MSFDFMKNLMVSMDDERFAVICESLEEVLREAAEEGERLTDLELMQALDFVGFNLFRDDWEEFKKLELPREYSQRDFKNGENLIN